MFRIDTASAAGALPAPAAVGSPGYFTNGNPGTGVPPTTITADWLNGIQEEMIAILTAAGIGESKTTFNQVLTALQALFVSSSGVASSFSTNGYAKLPGGLIIQWGQTASFSSETTGSVTFPIAFPHACLNAVISTDISGNVGNAANNMFQSYGVTSTGMGIYCQYFSASGTYPFTGFWIAIGY